ncbi:MAG: hypothetical protein EAZ85_07790 [Bacteroidetes bacterium]|nr:MAG: hypothetical protein EAZ85_07790 [Bacteroidota bacterium]TAG92755.1 MAG: hypothetical protein EAZ20_02255 [Bacteroidota bacterium]
MKKLIITSFICLIFSINAFAQSKKDKQFVAQEATNFLTAFNNADIDATLKYLYPQILINTGIKIEDFKPYYQRFYKQMGEMGQRYENLSIKNPSEIIVKDNIWQCAVPYETIITNDAQKMKIETKANLWAISENQGKTWRFIDLVQFDQNKIPTILPIFNTDLKISPLEQKKL